MKKVLLIGLILAILLLAFPQGVMAVTDPTAIINAELTPATLEFAVTEPASWTLVRGDNYLPTADEIKVEVDSSKYWTVSAQADASAHRGQMISQTVAAEYLENQLEIWSETAAVPAYMSLINLVSVHKGDPGNYGDTVFTSKLHQLVDPSDTAMNDYQITLTFTCIES